MFHAARSCKRLKQAYNMETKPAKISVAMTSQSYMSRVMRKPVFAICEQQMRIRAV